MLLECESDLSRLKAYERHLKLIKTPGPETAKTLCINPHLQLFDLSWRHLWTFFQDKKAPAVPEKGLEQVLLWRHPVTGQIRAKAITSEDLLVMKMAMESLPSSLVADVGNTFKAGVDSAVMRALDAGVLIGPLPAISRPFKAKELSLLFGRPRMFTLQWHITQACDLNCRHCYDRNPSDHLPMEKSLAVLEDFNEFCHQRNVYGQVTFTGGNPLLHPGFEVLYQAAADHGFTTSILGNPAPRHEIDRIIAIQPPACYQVSLEGLADHNDYMRGKGHFERTLAFLDLLKQMDIYSMVMLTLTRDNMDQVLALGELLRDHVDRFTFNRLSPTGQGARLATADTTLYEAFLERYMAAAETNPCLAMKDNLFNVLLEQKQAPCFGGCTGHGCGAAFNFVSVLANGDVHACRKFSSYLGSLVTHTLEDLFSSPLALKYRQGPQACVDCSLRWDCRGCMAVAHGLGCDVFKEKDPYCFRSQ
jgi:selenobiotic family peptide radical SAM maturase